MTIILFLAGIAHLMGGMMLVVDFFTTHYNYRDHFEYVKLMAGTVITVFGLVYVSIAISCLFNVCNFALLIQ